MSIINGYYIWEVYHGHVQSIYENVLKSFTTNQC